MFASSSVSFLQSIAGTCDSPRGTMRPRYDTLSAYHFPPSVPELTSMIGAVGAVLEARAIDVAKPLTFFLASLQISLSLANWCYFSTILMMSRNPRRGMSLHLQKPMRSRS